MNTNNTPSISVVMSVYNAEKHLSQAIESILNQSFNNFEFIIIEDCSTDNSLAIIQAFAEKDKRIKLIQKSENKRMAGFIENLNIGLKEAKGKYIARMDADDISHPTRFEKQVKFLNENPDIFMVGSCINLIDSEGKFIKNLYYPKSHKEIQEYLPKKQSLHHPTIMFRNKKDLFYRDKMFFCEDYDLFLNLISKGKKLYNIDEFLLNYRIHNSSISHNREQKFLQTIFVKKMKSFHLKENENFYEKFNPYDLMSILDMNVYSTEEDLLFSISVCLYFYQYFEKEYHILTQKYAKYYPHKKFNILSLKLVKFAPNILIKLFFKIKNNIK